MTGQSQQQPAINKDTPVNQDRVLSEPRDPITYEPMAEINPGSDCASIAPCFVDRQTSCGSLFWMIGFLEESRTHRSASKIMFGCPWFI